MAAVSGEEYYEMGDVEQEDVNDKDQMKREMAEAAAEN